MPYSSESRSAFSAGSCCPAGSASAFSSRCSSASARHCWSLAANALGLTSKASTRIANLDFHWWELAIEVGFAVIGTALAAAITHTRVAQTTRLSAGPAALADPDAYPVRYGPNVPVAMTAAMTRKKR